MSDTRFPSHLRPEVEADANRVIASFGGCHFVFKNEDSVLHYQYTTNKDGEPSELKPRKNVLAYLSDQGYSVQGFESYYA